MALSKANKTLLASVVSALAIPPGFAYLTVKQAKPLADAKLVEMNMSMANPAAADQFATRPTADGITANSAGAAPAAAPQTAAVASSFTLDNGVPLPTVKRGGGGGNVYPFDNMTVGQSFFVPATTDKPNPAKSLASTVSSASKRYADQTPARKFVVRSVDETAQGRSKGARVFRTV